MCDPFQQALYAHGVQGLAQEVDKYKVTGPHVELAKKMMARDPATAPNVGDRIPYVMIKVGL